MQRKSRMFISNEKAVYHVMSRTALDGFPLKAVQTFQIYADALFPYFIYSFRNFDLPVSFTAD